MYYTISKAILYLSLICNYFENLNSLIIKNSIKISKSSSNKYQSTMILNKLTQQFNIRSTIIEMNKDIYSFLKEEKSFNTRKTILNFPGLNNATHISEFDITFVNNLEETSESKKTLFYIPGLDMSAVSFFPHFLSMKSEYNIHSIVSGFNSNANFDDICINIEKYINEYIPENKEMVIIGESFGSLPALHIASKFQKKRNIKLIIINPATSYYKSIWYEKINNIGKNMSNSVLLDVISYGPSIIEIFKSIDYLKKKFPKESKYHTYAYFYVFINIFNISPQIIHHRVTNWIEMGINSIEKNKTVSKLKCQTLLLAGEDDNFLPSADEVQYLSTIIQNSKYIIIPNCSHYISINHCNLHKLIEKHF